MHQASADLPSLISNSAIYIGNIVRICFEHSARNRALVVFDRRSQLATILTEAYRMALPEAQMLDFDQNPPETILANFDRLQPGDLVILIQSGNFRLDAYRLRVELFKKQLKVIEHPHLDRMSTGQTGIYLDSLDYDPNYYRVVGPALKQRIDRASRGVIDSGPDARLVFEGGFEPAKLNIGDYRGMTNVGGQFPIGEVFTEALNLESVHGRVRIPVFGDTQFQVNRPASPVLLTVQAGRVVGVENSTPEFDRVLALIRLHEGEIWLRELGFGLNRAFTPERMVNDIGTYERMCGVHLSLGAKHGQYTKPQIRRADSRFHVDVFADTQQVELDDTILYKNGVWLV